MSTREVEKAARVWRGRRGESGRQPECLIFVTFLAILVGSALFAAPRIARLLFGSDVTPAERRGVMLAMVVVPVAALLVRGLIDQWRHPPPEGKRRRPPDGP